jgi:hypothetical protein
MVVFRFVFPIICVHKPIIYVYKITENYSSKKWDSAKIKINMAIVDS